MMQPSSLQTLSAWVDQAFCEDGVLSRLLLNYHPNPLQLEYAQRVAETLQAGEAGNQTSLTLLEGETGIGKSLAYLVPLTLYLAESGRRGVVSTYTLQLQNQLMQERGDLQLAIDVTEQLTGKRLNACIRKGMRNYVSLERVEEVVQREQPGASPENLQQLGAFLSWAHSSTSGDLQEWVEQAGVLPKKIQASEVSLSPLDRGEVVQRYKRDVEASRSADLLLVTHAMLVRHARHRLKYLGEELQPIELLVVDEADRLGQAEESLYTGSLDLNEVIDMVIEEVAAQGVVQQCRTLLVQLTRMRTQGERLLDLQRVSSVERSDLLNHFDLLYQSMSQLMQVESIPFLALERLYEWLGEIRELVGVVRKEIGFEPQSRLAVVEYGSGSAKLRLLPLSTGRLLSRLWRREDGQGLRSCLITSATLAGNSKQDHECAEALSRALGLSVVGVQLNYSLSGTLVPKQFGQMQYQLPDPRLVLPEPSNVSVNHEWIRYVVGMIATAHYSGHVLVLTTSFQDTKMIAECCKLSGLKVIEHKRGMKLDLLLPQFVEQRSSIMISPVAWEGVDLPGIIDHLVITRLPFLPPDSPYLLAQELHFRATGRSQKVLQQKQYEYQSKQAVRKFRQGLGRGIRRYDDEVTVWIADPRFPVPDEKMRRSGILDAQAKKHHLFAAAIPERFRVGPLSSWSRAKIFLKQNVAPPIEV